MPTQGLLPDGDYDYVYECFCLMKTTYVYEGLCLMENINLSTQGLLPNGNFDYV